MSSSTLKNTNIHAQHTQSCGCGHNHNPSQDDVQDNNTCCKHDHHQHEHQDTGNCCAHKHPASEQGNPNCCGKDHNQHEHEHEHEHSHTHEDKSGHHHHQHDHQTGGCCGHDHGVVSLSETPQNSRSTSIRKQPIPKGHQLSQWRIDDMDCPVEENMIRKQLAGMDNIKAIEFNLMQRTLYAVHTSETQAAIEAAIASLGMQAKPTVAGDELQDLTTPPAKQRRTLMLAIGGLILAIGAEATHYLELPALATVMSVNILPATILAFIAILLCGLGTYRKGLIAIRHGELNINALMSIAVTGAAIIGQWPEAAMVMALFTISEQIEARSLDRARNAIRSLLQLAPEEITVLQTDGSWKNMEPKAASIGDIVRVRPGQRIALDGTITQGQTTINQSALTGESLPVDKIPGDPVFAGTLNASGEFQFRITATAQNSTLARIIHAVEEAQSERAPTQRFVDQFAKYYTPAVVLIATLVAVLPPLLLGLSWSEWVYKALVMLVIACPCALVISTPVTIVSALTAATKRGLLVKGGVYMENGRFLRWIALDKTGTITHGKPVQTDIVVLPAAQNTAQPLTQQNIRQIATSLASRSDHPVSLAIAKSAQTDNIAAMPVDDFTAVLGQGTWGVINGIRYYLGNRRMAQELGTLTSENDQHINLLEQKGQTVVALSTDQAVLALFTVSDTIKPTSQQAIAQLHELGVNTLMLSGDNPHTAQIIAQQAGINEALGNQLPQDKLRAIEEKQQQITASGDKDGIIGMVGDGINDAPALARANIGFAMGAAGTDTAMETADVAIMDDDLRKIPEFIELSKRTHTILVQNITLALGIKAIFLLLTILGYGTMWMAVFADVGTSLLVVFNGLRMLRASDKSKV